MYKVFQFDMLWLEAVLPPDVIKYVLFPLLDVDSRISLNQCLTYKIGVRFAPHFAATHQLAVSCTVMRSAMAQVAECKGVEPRARRVLKVYQLPLTGHHCILLQQKEIVQMLRQKASGYVSGLLDYDERQCMHQLTTLNPSLFSELITTFTTVLTRIDATDA